MRLIDADKISLPIKDDTGKSGWDYGLMYAKHQIDTAPTIEAEPVRHGRWIHDYNNLYGCSECMKRETMSPKMLKPYCPNCGAKMDVTDINVGNKDGGAEQ